MPIAPTPKANGPGPEPPASLARIATRVEERLSSFLDAEATRWKTVDQELTPPIRAMRALVLAGGKRLRPAFCYWGFLAAGGDEASPVVADAGAALELLHAFALMHDDIIDDSATRRGRSTLHLAFEERHVAEALRGEARRFGEGIAMLIGDLAHVYADVLLDGATPAAVSLWNELRVELNMGQFLDVLCTARSDIDSARAWRITRYKSAKYTIERPLHLGAALAGNHEALARWGPHLSAYGLPLGEAFQLRDDVLGVFGDSSKTGKPVGDDLREGKTTPLLIAVRERTDIAARSILSRIGDPDLSEADVERLQKLFIDCGAIDEIEQTIDRLREEALSALDEANLTDQVTDALSSLAWFVTERDR